jgi:hypothetical protein
MERKQQNNETNIPTKIKENHNINNVDNTSILEKDVVTNETPTTNQDQDQKQQQDEQEEEHLHIPQILGIWTGYFETLTRHKNGPNINNNIDSITTITTTTKSSTRKTINNNRYSINYSEISTRTVKSSSTRKKYQH